MEYDDLIAGAEQGSLIAALLAVADRLDRIAAIEYAGLSDKAKRELQSIDWA